MASQIAYIEWVDETDTHVYVHVSEEWMTSQEGVRGTIKVGSNSFKERGEMEDIKVVSEGYELGMTQFKKPIYKVTYRKV